MRSTSLTVTWPGGIGDPNSPDGQQFPVGGKRKGQRKSRKTQRKSRKTQRKSRKTQRKSRKTQRKSRKSRSRRN